MQKVPAHWGRSLVRRGRSQPCLRMLWMLPSGSKNLQAVSSISFKLRPRYFSIAADDVANAFHTIFLISLRVVIWELQIACVRRSWQCSLEFYDLHPEIQFIACECRCWYVFAFKYVFSVLHDVRFFLHTRNLWIWFWVFMRRWASIGIPFSVGFLWFRAQFRVQSNWNASCLGHGIDVNHIILVTGPGIQQRTILSEDCLLAVNFTQNQRSCWLTITQMAWSCQPES